MNYNFNFHTAMIIDKNLRTFILVPLVLMITFNAYTSPKNNTQKKTQAQRTITRKQLVAFLGTSVGLALLSTYGWSRFAHHPAVPPAASEEKKAPLLNDPISQHRALLSATIQSGDINTLLKMYQANIQLCSEAVTMDFVMDFLEQKSLPSNGSQIGQWLYRLGVSNQKKYVPSSVAIAAVCLNSRDKQLVRWLDSVFARDQYSTALRLLISSPLDQLQHGPYDDRSSAIKFLLDEYQPNPFIAPNIYPASSAAEMCDLKKNDLYIDDTTAELISDYASRYVLANYGSNCIERFTNDLHTYTSLPTVLVATINDYIGTRRIYEPAAMRHIVRIFMFSTAVPARAPELPADVKCNVGFAGTGGHIDQYTAPSG